MSKRDLGDKLKSRLGEWQAYGDLPLASHGADIQQDAESDRKPTDLEKWESVALAPVRHMRKYEETSHSLPDPTTEQIAALQEALEYERNKSRRLLDLIGRDQMVHAVTRQSQRPSGSDSRHSSASHSSHSERHQDIHRSHNRMHRENLLLWVIVVVLIAVVCTCVAYALVP